MSMVPFSIKETPLMITETSFLKTCSVQGVEIKIFFIILKIKHLTPFPPVHPTV